MKGAQFVREARKRAGLTQAQLAERAATTQSAIARIESGTVAPTFERIQDLVRACGFDLNVQVEVIDDADWTLASTNLTYPPGDRLRQMLAFRSLARAARLAGEERRFHRTERAG